MTISSRTPEGLPQRCPICGHDAAIDFSSVTGDACCPACGNLLWWFRDRLPGESIEFASTLADIGLDSLDAVELVMQLEEEFDVQISDEDAAEINTIEDAIRYLRRRASDEGASRMSS